MSRVIKIKEGRHRPLLSVPTPLLTGVVKIRSTFEFTKSCLWHTGNVEVDMDWSKLMGFVFGKNLHWESYRFGFRPTRFGKIELVPYVYRGGNKIPTAVLHRVGPGDMVTLEIGFQDTEVWFWVYDGPELICWDRFRTNNQSSFGYTTGIYVGGTTKSGTHWDAPHDILIKKY